MVVCKAGEKKLIELKVDYFWFPLFILNLALEPRVVTRWDVHKYARRAYDLGIRYIGGCCGFEPYHTRAIAEEVRNYLIVTYFRGT